MKKLLLLLLVFNFGIVHAQDEVDPLDLTQELEKIEKYGVPTIETVDAMKIKADELYTTESWEQAADAYIAYAENVNYLANLIKSGLEPYYGASYDNKKNISSSMIKKLVPHENKFNNYINSRNEAFTRIAICYYKASNHKKALPYLLKALDYIDIEDTENWVLAMDALYDIIKYSNE